MKEITTDNQLAVLIENSGLEQSKAQVILEKFQDCFKIAAEWEGKAKTLIVTDETQIVEMKLAREGRLFLKQKRVDIEKTRKQLKEQSLREGKSVDSIANVLKALIIPIEKHLESQEKFVEIRQKKAMDDLIRKRLDQLSKYEGDWTSDDMGRLTEKQFQGLVENQETQIKERKAREEQERIDREAEEKERERVKAENEALKKERDAEKKKADDERAARERAELELKKEKDNAEKARQESIKESDRKKELLKKACAEVIKKGYRPGIPTGWEGKASAPLEFFHGQFMKVFHEWRKGCPNDFIDGSVMNWMIAQAKMATYKEYPHQLSQQPIPVGEK